MIKFFKNAFKITNENIILTTPLILFLIIISLYLGIAQNLPRTLSSVLILLITVLFMLAAFFSGWFYMIKKAIKLSKKEFIIDEDKSKASFSLIKELPAGIGEYFLPFIFGIIAYGILFTGFLLIGYLLGIHFVGKIGISIGQLVASLASTAGMKELLTTLSTEQLTKLNYWNLIFMSVMISFSFITMFWVAEIVFNTKNAVLAFFKALKFTFSHFLSSAIIFVYISIINFIISLVNAISSVHYILYFASMILYFYSVVYIIVLVFLYYDSQNEQTEN